MASDPRRRNVLFLCTANSARSILAETILNAVGGHRFAAFSAGSHPRGTVDPDAMALLRDLGHDVSPLRSKSWNEFASPGGPEMDLVVTVCDAAAGETCPYWPGRPSTAHWGLPDPAAVRGDDAMRRAAFATTYATLRARIDALLTVPFDDLDRATLIGRLNAIGTIVEPMRN